VRDQYNSNSIPSLLFLKEAVTEYGTVLPDLNINAGECIILKPKNSAYSGTEKILNEFSSFLTGMCTVKSGRAFISGKLPSVANYCSLVSMLVPEYLPVSCKSLHEYVRYYAAAKKLSLPKVEQEFKRALQGYGISYVLDASLNDITRINRGRISLALAMSASLLIVCVQDPCYYLDEDQLEFFNSETSRLRNEGSAVIIFSGNDHGLQYDRCIDV
jgi:hypothetical protein